ncbi:hypothetical protein SCHPADRAFT_420200 [Schizopora paradoxa]|uniref:Uncharacterized protein n=1 Tax=Schizopora paradoxa TaxID=27342 RepID=A0A0H2RKR0_9AGAM|nr:hypothetical protein SCHPADRAFT_420200 [Schizopora paradoxa]
MDYSNSLRLDDLREVWLQQNRSRRIREVLWFTPNQVFKGQPSSRRRLGAASTSLEGELRIRLYSRQHYHCLSSNLAEFIRRTFMLRSSWFDGCFKSLSNNRRYRSRRSRKHPPTLISCNWGRNTIKGITISTLRLGRDHYAPIFVPFRFTFRWSTSPNRCIRAR